MNSARDESLSKIKIPFATAEAFLQEYRTNISQGGIFFPTQELFELRGIVRVILDLEFRGESYDFVGEVVAVLPAPVPGIAVQFESAQLIREKLGPLVNAATQLTFEPAAPRVSAPKAPSAASPTGQRDSSGEPERALPMRAYRERAQVAVRIKTKEGKIFTGRTRNLSVSGALVAPNGPLIAPGEKVELVLIHPTNAEEFVLPSLVARHIQSNGVAVAMGLQFCVEDEKRAAAQDYIFELQAAEHSRRMSGIRGPIDELGLVTLLQMFAGFLQKGTLVVTRGEEQARIVFDAGVLKLVRFGSVTGIKALARVLTWQKGNFEFHTAVDPLEEEDPQLLNGAILTAVHQLDEIKRFSVSDYPLDAPISVDAKRLSAAKKDLDKTEVAVAELAQAGFKLRGILDVIPELDSEIYGALEGLALKALIHVQR